MIELSKIKGVGPNVLKKLHENNIFTTKDVLNTLPVSYETFKISSLEDQGILNVKGVVTEEASIVNLKNNVKMVTFLALVENKNIKVNCFNLVYITKFIEIGKEVVLIGKYEKKYRTFVASKVYPIDTYKEGIEPIYPIEGIGNRIFQKIALEILNQNEIYNEFLPKSLLNKYHLIDRKTQYFLAHNPKDMSDYNQVLRKNKYEELLKFELKIQMIKYRNQNLKKEPKKYDLSLIKLLIDSFPFELTDDQKKSTNDIFNDLRSNKRMNRLLQGDVGSGKTVVAILASFAAVTASSQVALMAPTEILAMQHYQTFLSALRMFNVEIAYLSSSTKAKDKKEIKEKLKNGKIDIIIGTHSLISDDVEFKNLSLIITDEQHRFGVEQRKSLREKGNNPDVLFMSATPIPRTLAISIFGDMDVSTIHTMPRGRKKVITKAYPYKDYDKVKEFVLEELKLKHQIYVVTPMIEDESDSASVYNTYDELKTYYKDFNVSYLHGKMDLNEKAKVLEDFYNNNINILVSTTVIEVGVNIENATVIIILDANRFGLSQLHQLRGRVGRCDMQSFCFLITDEVYVSERLNVLEETTDGFLIAEADLELRGPGDLLGKNQSGIPNFKYASLIKDKNILDAALIDASEIVSSNNREYEFLIKYTNKALKEESLD